MRIVGQLMRGQSWKYSVSLSFVTRLYGTIIFYSLSGLVRLKLCYFSHSVQWTVSLKKFVE